MEGDVKVRFLAENANQSFVKTGRCSDENVKEGAVYFDLLFLKLYRDGGEWDDPPEMLIFPGLAPVIKKDFKNANPSLILLSILLPFATAVPPDLQTPHGISVRAD